MEFKNQTCTCKHDAHVVYLVIYINSLIYNIHNLLFLIIAF